MKSKGLAQVLFVIAFIMYATQSWSGIQGIGYLALGLAALSGIVWLASESSAGQATSVAAVEVNPSNWPKALAFGSGVFLVLLISLWVGHDPNMTSEELGERIGEAFAYCAILTGITGGICRKPGASWLKVGSVFVAVLLFSSLVVLSHNIVSK
jgi:hypothetical protein